MARIDLDSRGGLLGPGGGRRVFVDSNHQDRPEGERVPGGGGVWLAAIGFVGLALLAGAVGAGIDDAAPPAWFSGLRLPPGTLDPRGVGPILAGLSVMTGLAAWAVWRRGRCGLVEQVLAARGLRLWGWQLLLNAAWMPTSLALHSPLLGLVIVVGAVGMTGATTLSFARIRRSSSRLMLPYLLWACYVAYLNAGVLWLNTHT